MDSEYEEAPLRDESSFGNFSIPHSAEEQQNIIKFQLDPNEEIARFAHVLRGHEWDNDEKKWKNPEDKHPRLNEKGVNAVMTYLQEGKTILLSDYKERDMKINIRVLINDLSRDIYDNYDKWEISNTSDADAIVDMVFTFFRGLFGSALDGNMRKYLQKQIRETHTVNPNQQQQSRKRFGII